MLGMTETILIVATAFLLFGYTAMNKWGESGVEAVKWYKKIKAELQKPFVEEATTTPAK